jgi:uncharacterized membrane protein YqiK
MMLEETIFQAGVLIFMVVIIVVAIALSYVVVPPNEAHVVVSRKKGRKVYCAREGYESSYWKLPIIQKRAVIPIENVQLNVNDIPLRDKEMAKFEGDVVAWLNINDPLMASERVGKVVGVEEITSDVINVIRAITRNMSMSWTIIDILKARKDFSQDVEKAVNEELKEWGMRLVELEVIHFKDLESYTVIKDLEERQSTVINAETRKLVALQNKEASIVESTAKKDAEITIAKNEQAFRTQQLEKDEAIGKRNQEKETAIAIATKKANTTKVEAEREMTVGQAKVQKDATVTEAEGKADAEYKIGEAKAKVVKVTGEAEGDVIRAKGFADADSTTKRAEALKLYNEAGIGLEIIKASQTVQIAQADAWAKAMSAAKIQVYAGGEGGSLFGVPISPQSGFRLGAFSEIAKEHGIDLQKIGESIGKGTLPVADVSKVLPKKEGKADVKK